MVTRVQRALRLLIAWATLTCAGAVLAEPVCAAPPSFYAASLELPAASAPDAARPTQRRVTKRQPVLRAASPRLLLTAAAPAQPALPRAPRLYLRHCVFLR